jgi:hypothetical protein
MDRETLERAIAKAIVPYAVDGGDMQVLEDPLEDEYVLDTAGFLATELIDNGFKFTEEDAELDDEDLENLPVSSILLPLIQQLLDPADPVRLLSNVIQSYLTPPTSLPTKHQPFGPCEVPP